eukprot:15032363-Alexandrium_andersonii.AAC.1
MAPHPQRLHGARHSRATSWARCVCTPSHCLCEVPNLAQALARMSLHEGHSRVPPLAVPRPLPAPLRPQT